MARTTPEGSATQEASALARPRLGVVRGRLRSLGWRALGVLLRPATLVLVGLLVGAALPLSWLTSGPSYCPFRLFTGLPCPGCGLTRSAVALLHGDLSASVFFHPLGAPIVVAAIVIGGVDAWAWWRSRHPDGASAPSSWLLERLMMTPAPWVAIGALALVWLVRLPLYVVGAWTF